MLNKSTAAIVLAAAFMSGAQDSRATDLVHGVRGDLITPAPRTEEIQAPRGNRDVQAPRSDHDVQAPRDSGDVQAPRDQNIQAPRG